MEEGRSGLEVAERRGAERVAQRRIALGLLEAEVLVLAGPIEDRVAGPDAEHRRELGATDPVRLEVAEHLVPAGDGVAGNAVGPAEEE